jgi:predicted MFS family arabinose efflux permease
MIQTRMLHSASARMRDTAAALQTTAFNVAIGGGALVGGLLLDGYGIGILPFADVAVMVFGIIFLVFSDLWLAQHGRRAHPKQQL